MRIGILAGAFNPPTVAHLALARAALSHVDRVIFALPQAFPHKQYEGASLEARIEMLQAAVAKEPSFSVTVTQGGLFREIAAEMRVTHGASARLTFLCGRDAAERILTWDYGKETSVAEMLREFDLLVAARRGEFEAPWQHRHAIERLDLADDFDHVSSTEIRQKIARGDRWQHLTPPEIIERAAVLYRPINP